MDLETQMKIDEIIDDAYERANELIDNFENSPDDRVYRTIRVQKGNPKSYTDAFYHYYSGVFEGLLMTLFLHKFDEWPTKEQKKFMQNSIFE